MFILLVDQTTNSFSSNISRDHKSNLLIVEMLVNDVKRDHEWIVHPLVLAKYPKGDMVGLFYGYYSLLVYEIQAIYITLFLWNRDLLTFYCCFTHLVSEIANILLKQTIKQPRPDNGAPSGGLFEGRYGMPSQHCHCFAYLSTTVLLLAFHYYKNHISSAKKGIALTLCLMSLILQVLGRIYLKFHTIEQCLIGVLFGAISAVMFYILGQKCFMPYADGLCKLFLLRQFSFRRDLVTSPPLPPRSQKSDRKAFQLNQHKNR